MSTEYNAEPRNQQGPRPQKSRGENPFATQINKFFREPFKLGTPLVWTTKDARGKLCIAHVTAAGGPMEEPDIVTVFLEGEEHYAKIGELKPADCDKNGSGPDARRARSDREWLVRAKKATQERASLQHQQEIERDECSADAREVAVLDGATGQPVIPFVDWPHTTDKGVPTRNSGNLERFLQTAGIVLYKNLFNGRQYIVGFESFDELNEETINALFVAVTNRGLTWPMDYFRVVVSDLARRNQLHPVRRYLDSLQWDGVPRIGGWLHTYLGADLNDYTKYVGAIMLVAAVRRVRQPGCKFDNMMVLEGAQGSGKSTCLRVLAGGQWFTDCVSLGDDPKKTIEQTSGILIAEVPEISARYRAEAEKIKTQLSTQVDRARKSYGRDAIDVPRQFIFVGTTNEGEDAGYLIDATGNRRFWPVKTGKIDIQALQRDRDQLWAEAAYKERTVRGNLTLPKGLWATAAVVQEARREKHPLEDKLADAIADIKDGFVRTSTLYGIIGLKDEAMHKHGAKFGALIKSVMRRYRWRPDYQTHPVTKKRHRGFSAGAGLPWQTAVNGLLEPEKMSADRNSRVRAV